MGKELDTQRQEFLDRLSRLPDKYFQAVTWLLRNYDFALELCSVKSLTEEERKRFKKKAKETDDALFLLLVEFESLVNSTDHTENQASAREQIVDDLRGES